jgi:2-amino-4-hydroxy-6-hydroxymethyldihydropteridine diphosphokinase
MIFIGLGANLSGIKGEPEQMITGAIKAISDARIRVVQRSRIWLTSPVPVSDQPWYRNAVIAVETDLEPEELLERLQLIENEFGRTRNVRNEPRVIDLDLLAYDDFVMETESLVLPHLRMHERAFVLLPLQEIAPDWAHPVLKQSLSELISELPDDQEAKPLED